MCSDYHAKIPAAPAAPAAYAAADAAAPVIATSASGVGVTIHPPQPLHVLQLGFGLHIEHPAHPAHPAHQSAISKPPFELCNLLGIRKTQFIENLHHRLIFNIFSFSNS